MKIRFSILIVMVAFVSTAFAQNNSLNGVVRYFNYWATPMHDSTTVYLMQGNTAIYQTTVDSTGHFEFSGILAGSYTLKANSIKKNGGINYLDMVFCFVCSPGGPCPPYITGIKLKALDVNGVNCINSADALAISKYIVGQIPNFMPPNVSAPGRDKWISETYTIQIQPNTTYTQDLKMICTGDGNGSFIPY